MAPAALLEQLRTFCLPGGADRAHVVKRVCTRERGEIRSAAGARWMTFSAEQWVDAWRSAYCWEARLHTGPLRILAVIDAYEDGHGRATVRLGGVVPVVSAPPGPDLDKGEMQRYLALLVCCPAALVNHPSLTWSAVAPRRLLVRDAADPVGSTVDLELDEGGAPLCVRAERPRTVGKTTVLTPWSGRYDDFRDWEGLRVPTRIQATWHLPDGDFTYFRGVTASLSTH